MSIPDRARGRILVVLNETGYFRLYGSTIVELERRGWDVVLAFDRPGKRGGAQTPPGVGAGVRSAGAIPDVGQAGVMVTLRSALDYARYLEPRFADADYLRRRSEKTVPKAAAWLTRVPRLPVPVVSGAVRLMRALERLVPPHRDARRFVMDVAPDLVFVSPLVTAGPRSGGQTEILKAARALHIPAVVGVASWDHLTSKGLVRIVPDALLVWNERQVDEAVELHRIPRRRVVVSGAQSLDHWFAAAGDGTASRWRQELGIAGGRPVLLFVGSSRNMAPGDSEPEFIRRWLGAVRQAPSPLVRDAFVVIRPHPTNTDTWRGVALDAGAIVLPERYSGIPLSDAEVESFGHCLQGCDAVVGVNTTAMIEAAIFERPVLTVRDGNFAHSQGQTLHFSHLTGGDGCVQEASTLDEHVEQLDAALRDPAPHVAAARRFVSRFVRPLGVDRRATDYVCDTLERLAVTRRRRAHRADFETPVEVARP